MLVHSGERPFSCQVCGQTFTTNGNMHRHRRTHNVRDSCESDGSGGSGAPLGTPGSGKRSRKRKAAAGPPAASSPTAEKLQHHLKATAAAAAAAASTPAVGVAASPHSRLVNETKYSAPPLPRCPLGCPDIFYSELSLELHLLSIHPGKEIRCEECGHPCPTYNYFKLHRNMFHFGRYSGGGAAIAPANFPLSQLPPPPVSCPPMTAAQPSLFPTGTIHQPLLITSQSEAPPAAANSDCSDAMDQPVIMAKKEEQEQQPAADLLNASFCSDNGVDDDPELREMKLKGEFPCRRCPAVFPNLRALKGHNKEHLINPPFECNVGTCTYSTADKSILLQHMRGHTGQKPYECRLCNFGFTTKANCERHVKNKHNKNSKEDVRDHIIIHEGLDCDDNDAASGRGGSESSGCPVRPARINSSTFFESQDPTIIFPPTPPRSSAFIPYRPFEVDRDIVDSEEDINEEEGDGEDAPLDLSQAAATRLPLATKYLSADLKIDAKESCNSTDSYNKLLGMDESKKSLVMDPVMMGLLPFGGHQYPGGPAAAFPFGFPLLGGPPPTAAAPFWPPQFMVPPGGAGAPFPFNPMHLAALLAAKKDDMKKADSASQQLQEAATNTALQALNQLQQQAAQHHDLLSQISPASSSSLSAHSPQSSPLKTASCPAPGGPTSSESESSSSYKMIIKNGVLMRKQKQRRYRTERPYGCEACKARFTLRSNMDRHMKQQHPDVYYQKPRSGPGRKPAAVQPAAGHSTEEQPGSRQLPHLTNQDTPSRQLEQQQQEQAENKTTFDTDEEEEEEEEGRFLEEEEAEQDLVIDDGDKAAVASNNQQQQLQQQNFKNISQFFAAQNGSSLRGRDELNEEAGSVSSRSSSSGAATGDEKKQLSAYSAAPHRMSCPYCGRKFPWASSLERHILTHTGQKPYRCTDCPLWFTTKSNCDRHIVRKHGGSILNNNNNEEGVEKMGNWEDRDSEMEEEEEEEEGFLHLPGAAGAAETAAISAGRRDSTGSESPYKCHLCDEGFVERSAAIQHLETSHAQEYSLLMARGAFSAGAPEEPAVGALTGESGEELYDQLRGKFPDYVNRKVVCLFCARKFWSAEDLRRHVRTHTGERPYSCDICARRFTLKHSMLRHKKKHDSGVSSNGEEDCRSDEDDCVGGGSHRSSSGDRSSPEQLQSMAAAVGAGRQQLADSYDRKRANLMEKISRLNSATESSH
jgi:hypothetical protein